MARLYKEFQDERRLAEDPGYRYGLIIHQQVVVNHNVIRLTYIAVASLLVNTGMLTLILWSALRD